MPYRAIKPDNKPPNQPATLPNTANNIIANNNHDIISNDVKLSISHKFYEVIGNIYENQELQEVQ